jgi:hypothetical protein
MERPKIILKFMSLPIPLWGYRDEKKFVLAMEWARMVHPEISFDLFFGDDFQLTTKKWISHWPGSIETSGAHQSMRFINDPSEIGGLHGARNLLLKLWSTSFW